MLRFWQVDVFEMTGARAVALAERIRDVAPVESAYDPPRIMASTQRYARDWEDANPEQAVIARESEQPLVSDDEIASIARDTGGEVVEV